MATTNAKEEVEVVVRLSPGLAGRMADVARSKKLSVGELVRWEIENVYYPLYDDIAATEIVDEYNPGFADERRDWMKREYGAHTGGEALAVEAGTTTSEASASS